jgi:hypothetical protein
MTAAWSMASGEPRDLPILIPSFILCFKSGKEGWVIGRVAHTDSYVVYYSLVKGTGLTLQASPLLQILYVRMLILKNKAGHGLVVRWIPSE